MMITCVAAAVVVVVGSNFFLSICHQIVKTIELKEPFCPNLLNIMHNYLFSLTN